MHDGDGRQAPNASRMSQRHETETSGKALESGEIEAHRPAYLRGIFVQLCECPHSYSVAHPPRAGDDVTGAGRCES
jgi:hypothetical protein